MENIKKVIYRIFSSLFTNYKNPTYFYPIYFFAKNYVKFYENDENSDLNTNGERYFIRNILKRLNPGVVFDIGANRGEYSEMIIQAGIPAKIHCFEPDGRVFKELQNKFQSKDSIQLNNFGLGEKQGKSSFNLNVDDPGLNSILDMNTVGYSYRNTVVEINLDTIDNYCLTNGIKRIDFIKIDVEGFEIPILKGGINTFKEGKVGAVQFEYGNASIASRTFLKDFYDFFWEMGFDIYKIMHKGLLLQNYSPFNEGISYANFVAVSKEIKIADKYLIKR